MSAPDPQIGPRLRAQPGPLPLSPPRGDRHHPPGDFFQIEASYGLGPVEVGSRYRLCSFVVVVFRDAVVEWVELSFLEISVRSGVGAGILAELATVPMGER
jgi:hypothetical protein